VPGFRWIFWLSLKKRCRSAAWRAGIVGGVGYSVVVIVLEDVFVEPRDHLGNAAFAQLQIGHFQAVQLEQLAAYARATEGDEFAHLEIAARLHISDAAARRRLRFATSLTQRLPETLAALKQGWIEEFKAQLIADAVEPLSDEHALVVESRVLDHAARWTPTQLRNRLAKVVMTVDPEGAEERRRERVRGRRVESQPTEPGMAMLTVHHTTETIAAAQAVITGRARELKALGGDTRTLAQIEADVACDLILGEPGGRRVVEVHLTMPATTALGANEPGDVDGLPVTAHAARELMREATSWRWLRTNPTTGAVTDLTTSRYTPPDTLKTFLRVRDRTCRFPGCTRRARGCDIDHRDPWPHGTTSNHNCQCLCRRHHRAKHEGGWQVTVKPGWWEWTTPLGFTHRVTPEPVTESRPADPNPPPF
jgi:hypothetical protein